MKLITGGMYQGKLEYALETYKIDEADVCDLGKLFGDCLKKDAEENITEESRTEGTASLQDIDYNKRVIYGLEYLAAYCVEKGLEAREVLEGKKELWKDSIIIATDMSCGLVPLERDHRQWREMNGRMLIYLAGEAETVIRIFCGLPQVVKDAKKKKDRVSCIHLIRHGTTEGNEKRWYYGASDIPLTADGRELIGRLAENGIYPEHGGMQYYTTGLTRTEETMEIIYGRREHQHIDMLREMNFGEFEKKTHEELQEEEAYQKWISDRKGHTAPPGGESPEDFRTRVRKGLTQLLNFHKLQELSSRHEGRPAHSVVVCHGGVISQIMLEFFPNPNKTMYDWIPDPGHGYTVFLKDGKASGYDRF